MSWTNTKSNKDHYIKFKLAIGCFSCCKCFYVMSNFEDWENIIHFGNCFWFNTGVIQKVLPVLSTETFLHIWLSTEYYGFRPSSTVVDTVSLHALDPTVPRKQMQIGFL